jgi:glutamate/tyrosine decarboxylase-like PLP-dependent enzyme
MKNFFKVLHLLYPAVKQIARKKVAEDLGSLDTPALPITKLTTALFSLWNTNHLGNWSGKQAGWGTKPLERKCLEIVARLYQTDLDQTAGYLTTGASEGNIFLAWMGRSYLEKKGHQQITLLCTSLSHYSVHKCARIIKIPTSFVQLSGKHWSMDPASLQEVIKAKIAEGVTGFLIPFTVGYSTTGTIDNYEQLSHLLEKLKKQYPHVDFFCWVDAALNGVFLPFTQSFVSPFHLKNIHGVVMDFHKFGLTPPTCGMVLYKRSAEKYITADVNYLPTNDTTLLGGRSGMPAVNLMAALTWLGDKGMLQRYQACLKVKEYFINKLDVIGVRYITHPQSLTLGLLISQSNRFSKKIEDDFSLYYSSLSLEFTDRTKQIFLYKLFILPHVHRKTIDQFIQLITVTQALKK